MVQEFCGNFPHPAHVTSGITVLATSNKQADYIERMTITAEVKI
jgi:hypothetical protein